MKCLLNKQVNLVTIDEEENTIVRLCLQLICPESSSSSYLFTTNATRLTLDPQ